MLEKPEYKYENSRARGISPSRSFVTALVLRAFTYAYDDFIKIYYRRDKVLLDACYNFQAVNYREYKKINYWYIIEGRLSRNYSYSDFLSLRM